MWRSPLVALHFRVCFFRRSRRMSIESWSFSRKLQRSRPPCARTLSVTGREIGALISCSCTSTSRGWESRNTRQHRRSLGQGEGCVCANAGKVGRGRMSRGRTVRYPPSRLKTNIQRWPGGLAGSAAHAFLFSESDNWSRLLKANACSPANDRIYRNIIDT